MKRLIQMAIVSTFILIAGITLANNIQIVELINNNTSIHVGEQFAVTTKYTTPLNEGSFGVGIRIHYDSTKLKFVGFKDTFAIGKILEDSIPKDDSKNDFDQSTDTDKYVVIAWGSTANYWPNMPTPVDLTDIMFESIASGTTEINVSFSEASNGYKTHAGTIAISVEQ